MGWIYMRHDAQAPISDNAGGWQVNWQTVGWLWAERADITGFRDRDDANNRQFFRVRWILRDAPLSMKIGDRLVDGGFEYEILSLDGLGRLHANALTRTETPNASI